MGINFGVPLSVHGPKMFLRKEVAITTTLRRIGLARRCLEARMRVAVAQVGAHALENFCDASL